METSKLNVMVVSNVSDNCQMSVEVTLQAYSDS